MVNPERLNHLLKTSLGNHLLKTSLGKPIPSAEPYYMKQQGSQRQGQQTTTTLKTGSYKTQETDYISTFQERINYKTKRNSSNNGTDTTRTTWPFVRPTFVGLLNMISLFESIFQRMGCLGFGFYLSLHSLDQGVELFKLNDIFGLRVRTSTDFS